jgi:hypothetical protein
MCTLLWPYLLGQNRRIVSLGDHNTFTKSMQSTYVVDQVSDHELQQMEQCMPPQT